MNEKWGRVSLPLRGGGCWVRRSHLGREWRPQPEELHFLQELWSLLGSLQPCLALLRQPEPLVPNSSESGLGCQVPNSFSR